VAPNSLLQPLLEVMRPACAATVPAEGAIPGGALYQLKLDGFRALTFSLPDGPRLQSRSGGDLTPRFPELHDALGKLPVGTVLDGEVTAWHQGKFAFEQLLRTHTARQHAGVAVSYVAFDILATSGGHGGALDLRRRTLAERWGILTALLGGIAPPVEVVMATRDRAEAMAWFDGLRDRGVEGLVVKPLSGTYGGHGWVKIRHSDSIDAEAVALFGTPARPTALLVRLLDGHTVATTPRLDVVRAGMVADAAADLVGDPAPDREHGHLWPLTGPLPVEVRVGGGRHATVRFVRVRGE